MLTYGEIFTSKMQSLDNEKKIPNQSKAKLKNKRLVWCESRRRSRRNSRNVWKSCKNASRLTRNWKQPTPNRPKPNMRWRFWWLNKRRKTPKLSIKEFQWFSHARQAPLQTWQRNEPFSLSVQIRCLDAQHGVPQCLGTACGGWRDGRGCQENQPDYGTNGAATGSRERTSRTWTRSAQSAVRGGG